MNRKYHLLRILTDRGTEVLVADLKITAYQLYLGVENIDHSRTKGSFLHKLMAYVKGSSRNYARMNATILSSERKFTPFGRTSARCRPLGAFLQ
ncbi:hypothetical protein TNCT_17321 [Trichonephila clavata]|uniref:Uncharacterized protein n=1 Tax=Trichonephila clavata TaxID=2740835 RepID=A0A8X6IY76_TRICU|nr:hypothetical protein TNCT_17321 [Trichonephila clavata]